MIKNNFNNNYNYIDKQIYIYIYRTIYYKQVLYKFNYERKE